jgi:hypothetical protein
VSNGWSKCDGWYRRELGDGSYLTVTRSTLTRQLVVDPDGTKHEAAWHWHQRLIESGTSLAGSDKQFASAYAAMAAADRSVESEASAA